MYKYEMHCHTSEVSRCGKISGREMADFYATKYKLNKFCGSDNHTGKRERIAALGIDFKAKSICDIISAVKEGKYKISLYNID